jgi:hypothetical protein
VNSGYKGIKDFGRKKGAVETILILKFMSVLFFLVTPRNGWPGVEAGGEKISKNRVDHYHQHSISNYL